MNDNISKTITWLDEYLPKNALVLKEDKAMKRTLPLNISAPYQFFIGSFSDTPVIWVQLRDCEEIAPSIIKRHGEIINQACGLTPIFIIEKIESYKIQRLAKTHVNFIIPGKVVYLPSLLFIVRNQSKTDASMTKIRDIIPAVAQLMVLYHIQKQSLNGLSAQQIAELFKVSYATSKRAVEWLVNKGVISLTGKKEKVVSFKYESKALWDFCEKLLRSPVESLHQTNDLTGIKEYEIAGEQALSHYSMLSDNTKTIAISKKELTRMNKQFKGWDNYGEYNVQTWIYDPKILANENLVDPLSLYLSLKEHYDERVQIELENMINVIKW